MKKRLSCLRAIFCAWLSIPEDGRSTTTIHITTCQGVCLFTRDVHAAEAPLHACLRIHAVFSNTTHGEDVLSTYSPAAWRPPPKKKIGREALPRGRGRCGDSGSLSLPASGQQPVW
jgi:hypothetical protein